MGTFAVARDLVNLFVEELAAPAAKFPHLRAVDCICVLKITEGFVGSVLSTQQDTNRMGGLVDQLPQNLSSQR